MSAECSVKEVREMASVLLHNPKPREWKTRAGKMLTAYANRIEADESAVPFGYYYQDSLTKPYFKDAEDRQPLGWRAGEMPLFTHPPAQAAQVDLQKVFDALNRSAPIPEIIRHVPGAERLHAEAHAMVRDALAPPTAAPVAHDKDKP